MNKELEHKNVVQRYGNTTVFFLWDKQLQQHFKGVSVCDPEDTYDEEYGLKIAKTKAILKMQKYREGLSLEMLAVIDQFKMLEKKTLNELSYWVTKANESEKRLDKILKERT